MEEKEEEEAEGESSLVLLFPRKVLGAFLQACFSFHAG
jgi:hypothetical protein